ncbi:hypothetical protein Cgig2_003878 [Carnegiea gigantea]|uniref:Prolamin-like domain-containing protein n=1 Tax=Carnegiea gigantea TaxID=171969 RepID=A0A9Q1GK64_9CARY|nr:hypothetical protein Cgig2_003878 [Carnegiea gigantea]
MCRGKGGFSTEETEEILERNSEVWNLCKRSGPIGGTQAAPATIVQPLKGCAGKEVGFDNSGILSEKCCEQLLNAGRECHDSETNSILSEGEFSKEEREEILAKHSEVWNLCKRSGHIGGTQPVPAPTVQPLTGRAGKVTSACGPKVYAFMFGKSGVLSEKCCELLLNAGRQCHDSETNSILSEGEFSTEEKKEIMKRHNQVWNLCKKNGHIDIENPWRLVPGLLWVIIERRKECHDNLTNSILSKGGFSTEETEEILERNSEVWNLCNRSGHIGGTQAAPATIVQPLKGCAGKVTSACGPKIYEFVFDNSGILSEKCCEQLLNAGRECHDSDTNSILSEGEFSKEEREEILARHSEVWNLCKRSGHIGGTQPVPAPTVVQGKVTSACGPKVYAFVFDKSGILSEKCCELLLNAGRQCHDSETNSILSEGEFSAEEKKEIMKRHNQVWNLCKKNGHIDIENTVF